MPYEIRAILSNPNHQDYGQASVPFSIPNEDYDGILELLRPLEIGSATNQDCQIDEIHSPFPVLKRLESSVVKLDELDFLAKRLDSLCAGEETKFQAMAEKLQITSIKDFINLTFCCQQTTVISDFSNLEQIGKDHYMNLNGGCASTEELENLDGEETARLLIDSGAGEVTPYGVIYDNGMKLKQHYDGRNFPDHLYDDCEIVVSLSPATQPEVHEFVYLPCPDSMIHRALERLGVDRLAECSAGAEPISVSGKLIEAILDCDDLQNHMRTVNEFCAFLKHFQTNDKSKFAALVEAVGPETPEELLCLIRNFGDFTVAPKVYTPEEYGRYIIQKSGHFDVDPNLGGYFDYKKYGEQKVQNENGAFTEHGYVAYLGTDPQVEDLFIRGMGLLDGRDMVHDPGMEMS